MNIKFIPRWQRSDYLDVIKQIHRLANKKHLKVLLRGSNPWNKWRARNFNQIPDLSGVDLSGIDLKGANLFRANLKQSILQDANLSNANLSRANLFRVNLREANLNNCILNHSILTKSILSGANLSNANLNYSDSSNVYLKNGIMINSSLRNCNLSNANLENVNFTRAVLENTNFHQAYLGGNTFSFTSLNSCLNLDTTKASYPSSLDTYTLKKSKALTSSTLVSKFGLPEVYVDYIPDLLDANPIKMFPVFLSHSSEDKDFTSMLYKKLSDESVPVWYDEHDIMPGDKIKDRIDSGITLYDKLLLVCSKESLNSWWVKEEIERILKKEREYQRIHKKEFNLLIPITIDDAIFSWKSPDQATILQRNVGDFKDWKNPDKFELAFRKLLISLDSERSEKKPISRLFNT